MTKNKTLIIIAILAMSTIGMVPGTVTPAIANLAMAFPQVDPSLIMMLATLPSLLMVPGNLISGAVTGKFIKFRTMIIFSFILLITCGVAPYFLNDFIAILITRGVFGLVLGFIMPLGPALIFGLIEGKDQANVMGLTGVFMNIGGIVFQMLGGVLCVISWRHTFLAHLVAVILLIAIVLWLPNPPEAPKAPAGAPAAPKVKMPIMIWVIGVLFGINFVLMMPVFLNMSLIIVGGNMGNAASAGFVLMMNTVGGMAGGALFGKVFQKAGRFTLAVGLSIAAVGFALLATAGNLPLLTVGSAITGFGFSLGMPAVMMAVGAMVPPHATPLAMAIMNSFSGVGGFVAPMIFAGIMGALKITWIRFPIVVGLVCIAIFVVIYTLINLRSKPAPSVSGGPPADMAQ
ncbi:MAG: MFS transporter [Clostridiales bacterium]|jgi:MFS family permease|nr:MFS transporter [Eubacteriales bacterium]MDH7567882.1 MFS transporter [Clostridiales bacterium]